MSYDWELYGDPKIMTLDNMVDNGNFTYNIDRLLRPTRWVGLRFRDFDGMRNSDISQIIADVIYDWNDNKSKFEALEVPDWGNLEQCHQFLKELYWMLLKHPNGSMEVSS